MNIFRIDSFLVQISHKFISTRPYAKQCTCDIIHINSVEPLRLSVFYRPNVVTVNFDHMTAKKTHMGEGPGEGPGSVPTGSPSRGFNAGLDLE